MVFTQSLSLCLLIGNLWPFALKVIFEKGLLLFMVMFVVLVGLVILPLLLVVDVHWFAMLDIIDSLPVLFCSVAFMECVLSYILVCETVFLHYLKKFLQC